MRILGVDYGEVRTGLALSDPLEMLASAVETVTAYQPEKAARAVAQKAPSGEQGTLFDSFANSKAFQDMVRTTVLEVLRSPEGQNLLTQAIRKELSQRH